MVKNSLLYKKSTTSRANNSRILRIKNAKFPGYCCVNTDIYEDFQICISVQNFIFIATTLNFRSPQCFSTGFFRQVLLRCSSFVENETCDNLKFFMEPRRLIVKS